MFGASPRAIISKGTQIEADGAWIFSDKGVQTAAGDKTCGLYPHYHLVLVNIEEETSRQCKALIVWVCCLAPSARLEEGRLAGEACCLASPAKLVQKKAR